MVAPNDFQIDKFKGISCDRVERAAESRVAARYDVVLVKRFNSGDETAFSEIVMRYRMRLTAIAFNLLRNRADAEEIAQDALMRAHRGLATFRGESSLISWLHCITVNLARNRYWYFHRRCRHAACSLDSGFGEDRSGRFSDYFATDESGPDRQTVAAEFSEIVAKCTSQLSVAQREILELRVARGQTYEMMAAALCISVGTVKSRVARARQSLRQLLTQVCPEFRRGDRPETWFDAIRPASGIFATRA